MVSKKIETIIEEIKIANQRYYNIEEIGTPEKRLAFQMVNSINKQALSLVETKEDLDALKEIVLYGTDAHREIEKRLSVLI